MNLTDLEFQTIMALLEVLVSLEETLLTLDQTYDNAEPFPVQV